MKDDLARELDERDRHRRRILAGDHDACALVAHLANDFDQSSDEVRALDVFVGLIEYDELVERALDPRLVAILCVSEELEEHNEEAECLVLLDELVAEVDDD